MAQSKWQLVADALRQRIESGNLQPGQQLPTYDAIETEFDVGRGVVARALRSLAADGLTIASTSGTRVAFRDLARPGDDGSIVAYAPVALPTDDNDSFTRATIQDGTVMETVNRFTFAGHAEAPPYVAQALDIEVGASCVMRFRERRTTSGAPVLIAESWCPYSYATIRPEMLLMTDTPGGLGPLFNKLGRRCTRVVESNKADIATAYQRDFYGLAPGSPILIKDHTWLADDGPLFYGRGWHPPHKWSSYYAPFEP